MKGSIEWFMRKVSVDARTGCWNHVSRQRRYGQRMLHGKLWRINRLAFTLFKGSIPDGLLVCHSCDNTFCVNPEHLFLGTHKDNTQDSVQKGRHARGTKQGGSKTNEDTVRRIREEYRPNNKARSCSVLGKKYGLSPKTVRKIINRTTWTHI